MEKQRDDLRDRLVSLAKKYNDNRYKADMLKEENKQVKEEIIALMEELGEKSQFRDNYEVKYSIPHYFDEGEFRKENPETAKIFTSSRIVTETIEEFNDKEFKKQMPDLYEQYRVPGTPRLTIKYHVPQDVIDKLIMEDETDE